jgi:hypothetical protein
VQQHEGALGVDVHVARDAERCDALHAVAEQRDHREVVADRQLAGVEQGAARHAELAAATAALPANGRLGQRVDLDHAAVWAERLAVVGGEADRDETRVRVFVRHQHDAREAQRPRFGRQQEVLRQGANPCWDRPGSLGIETALQRGYIPPEDRDRGANPSLRS